jgi:ribulose kinase
MRRALILAPLLFASACGQGSDKGQLQDAANQSDPAAAQVLNGAAQNGMDPQAALNEAGQAAAGNTADANSAVSMQARPNTAQQPNPPQDGEPPQKTATNAM